MKKSDVLFIYDQESYLYIYHKAELLDYYNYMARNYQQMEMYRQNQLNFIEYIVHKDELLNFMKNFNYSVEDIQKNPQLIYQLPIDDFAPANKSYLRVPDYLLKTVDSFVLPIHIVSNKLEDVLLFNHYVMQPDTLKEIKKIFNQYCFYNDKLEVHKDLIVNGQNIDVSPHLLNLNTYIESSYVNQYAEHILQGKEVKFVDSKYDHLFISELDGRYFSVKWLHIFFIGSQYECRNFFYYNNQILNNVLDCIYHDFAKNENVAFELRPAVDRFISAHSSAEIYTNIVNSLYQLPLIKDTEIKDVEIPNVLSELENKKMKIQEDFILLSTFIKKSVQQNNVIDKNNVINKKQKKEIDIERIMNIHNKKYSSMPFPYTKE